MDVDPAASMRVWAVDIEVGGRTFEVPALPASEWFPVLAEGDTLQILDFIRSSPAEDDNLDELILTGRVGTEELTEALTDAIEAVAGRPFHSATVLAMFAAAQWPVIGGELARRGFRWDVMPLGAALDAIYVTITDRMKSEDLPKFLALLDNPGPLRKGKGKVNRDQAMADFENLAGPKPEGVRSSGARSGSGRPKTRPRPRPPRQDAP